MIIGIIAYSFNCNDNVNMMTNVLLIFNNNYHIHKRLLAINVGKKIILCLLLALVGCSKAEQNNQIQFNPIYQGQWLNCSVDFKHQEKYWYLKQFQFFISNVSLKDKQGSWHSWLMKKNAHQTHNIALIGQQCIEREGGFNEWNIDFLEKINLKKFTAIKFTLGVPFKVNHLNPLNQPNPLNDSSMFWVWQTGHKFLRLELQNTTENWFFHLGSTGCKAPSAVRSPKDECIHPNRVGVELALPKIWENDKNQDQHQPSIQSFNVNINLEKLLNGLALNTSTFCQSSAETESCKPLFLSLGINDKRSNNRMNKTGVFEIKINE